MQERRKTHGVVLPEGHSGSSLLHLVLTEAVAEFPDALGHTQVPSNAGAFKRDYGKVLARFEAARCASQQRVEIARFVARRTQQSLNFIDAQGEVHSLVDYLARPGEAVSLREMRWDGAPSLAVEVPLEGDVLSGPQVLSWVEGLREARQVNTAVRDAIAWVTRRASDQGGRLDLRGQRFVVLGAAAELAPTRMLLRAGARVLWVDLADPQAALASESGLCGELVYSPEACNLLEQPRQIASAIRQFADGEPVHLGMFAYAGGETQEWRLGAAMNAIAASLPPDLVQSVGLFVSPTSPGSLTPETVQAAAERAKAAPWWQRSAAAVGLLDAPGHLSADGQAIALATVSLQGLSYQAAQYISKLIAAESYAVHGTQLHDDARRPVTVSCNVAGITRTRSLSHPLFEAAFAGAHHFGVRIFDAETTRALNGLLLLHDVLNPEAPGAAQAVEGSARERAARLHTQQVHGGVYGLPYAIEEVIRMAAVLGGLRHPSILMKRPAKPAAVSAPAPTAAPTASPAASAPAPAPSRELEQRA